MAQLLSGNFPGRDGLYIYPLDTTNTPVEVFIEEACNGTLESSYVNYTATSLGAEARLIYAQLGLQNSCTPSRFTLAVKVLSGVVSLMQTLYP